MTQESPSKFFPTVSGISGRVPRRTTIFGMASEESVAHIFARLVELGYLAHELGGELRENMAKDRLQQPEFDKTLIPVR